MTPNHITGPFRELPPLGTVSMEISATGEDKMVTAKTGIMKTFVEKLPRETRMILADKGMEVGDGMSINTFKMVIEIQVKTE